MGNHAGESSQKKAKSFKRERVSCPISGCNWQGPRNKAPRHCEVKHGVSKEEGIEYFQLSKQKQHA